MDNPHSTQRSWPIIPMMAVSMAMMAEDMGNPRYVEGCRKKKPWNHGPSKKVKSARKRSKISRRKNRKK